MPDIGVPELLIVLVVILLIFGSSRLPKLARSIGQAKHAFEEALGRHPPRTASWLDPTALAAGERFAADEEVDDRPGHGGEGAAAGRPSVRAAPG